MAFSADDAKFTINGDPAVDGAGDRGYDATTSEQLDCTLEASPSPAISVRYQVFDPADAQSPKASKGAPNLTWIGSGDPDELLSDPNGTASVVMPGSVLHAYRIRATVSTPEGDFFFERLVVIRGTVSGVRKSVPAESVEYEARSFSDMLNEYADVMESGVATGQANTASNTGSGVGIFDTKVGADLRFKSLVGVGDITVIAVNGEIEIRGNDLLPLDGSRVLTGTIDFGGFNIDNVDTIIGDGVVGPRLRTEGSDQNAAVIHQATGTNGATGNVFIGDRDPVGNVTGNPGDIYRRIGAASSTVYVHVGAVADNTSWLDLANPTPAAHGSTHDVGAADPITSGAAPADVTKAAAAAGVGPGYSRADHKHDISTAAPLQGIGGGNAEGVATSVARSDHDHAIRETDGPTDLTVGDILDGEKTIRIGTVLRGATRVYGESEGESTITGTTAFQQKLRVSLPAAAPAGTYRIAWNYTFRHSATNTDYLGQVEIDDTTVIWSHVHEPKDTAADQRLSASGFREVALAAGAHDFDLDFATSNAGDTSGISQARLSVELVGA